MTAPTVAPWPASTGDSLNGAPVRKKLKKEHGKGRELTASPVEAFSAFGTGSTARGRRRRCTGERESMRMRLNLRIS